MIHTCRQSPKFKKFVRRLRPIAQNTVLDAESVAVAILERLWHATAVGAKRGDIGRFDNELIAEECGWLGDADLLIGILVKCDYLDECTEHRLLVHDWHEHAPNHVKGAVKRMGGFLVLRSDPIGADSEVAPQTPLPPNLTNSNQTKPNPTTPNDPWESVVVVLLELGVLKAKAAVAKAREMFTVDQAQNIIRHWSAIPGAQPGTLFNWLTVNGSFDRSLQAEQEAKAPPPKRAKDTKLEWENHRTRCIKRGREQGMTEAEIETRLEEMKPKFMEQLNAV